MIDHMSEYEPLNWLTSLLFTEQFADRTNLVSFYYDPESGNEFVSLLGMPSIKPLYKTYEQLYAAVDQFIHDNEDAAKFYQVAQNAVKDGVIPEFEVKLDEWGEPQYQLDKGKVNSYQFLVWTETQGYALPAYLSKAIEFVVHRHITEKQAAETHAYQYPVLTREQFSNLYKEPLWQLSTAVVYVFGHRSRSSQKGDADFIKYNEPAEKLVAYMNDAVKAGHLVPIDFTDDTNAKEDSLLSAKIQPEKFINWVSSLPIKIPFLSSEKPMPISPSQLKTSYTTPQLDLMLEAMVKFWSDFDTDNPNRNAAPLKGEVTEWILKEANLRAIECSKTLADSMDTIIRHPVARKGGNSL